MKKSKTVRAADESIGSVIFDAPSGTPEVFGQPPERHLRKMLKDSGAGTVIAVDEDLPENAGTVMVWNGAVACSVAMAREMLGHKNFLLEDQAGRPLVARVDAGERAAAMAWMSGDERKPSGMHPCRVEDFGAIYNRSLRKSEAAFCVLVDAGNLREVERRIYLSTYKGVTDFVTKYVWPRPALFLTRLFLRMGLTPNVVTLVGLLMMFAAMILFWEGRYGMGLLAAWIMALLDTVDGKMARVSHTSSMAGELLDHGMDLIHPPFWYAAWAVGLAKTATPLPAGWLAPLIWVLFVTYIVIRLAEGYYIRRFGFHIHVWRRFDSVFRSYVARRNPNLVIFTVMWAFGRPDIGLLAVAGWHVVSLAVHGVQIVQAHAALKRGPLVSWLEREAGKSRKAVN